MSPAAALLSISLATAGGASGFPFRVDPGPTPASSGATVPIELQLDAADDSRIDVLVSTSRTLPRWTWRDGGRAPAGRATIHAPAGARVLVVVRRRGLSGYALDGPFTWPDQPGRRRLRPTPSRALRGRDPAVGGVVELRLVGRPPAQEPLCETDGVSEWQCIGTPADFSGKVAICADGRVLAEGDAGPDGPAETNLSRSLFAALVRIERSDPGDGEISPATLRVFKPGPAGGQVLLPDPAWTPIPLGDELHWLRGPGEPAERILEVRSPGYATRQVRVADLPPPCAPPAPVSLARAVTLRGTVADPDGSPVSGASVLVRSEDADRERRIFGDAETDRDGRFELSNLEQRTYRLRACQGALGCAEESGAPGAQPIEITLRPRASFRGRVLSSAGVPEPEAMVRIVPTLESYASASDRVRYLPLEVPTGSDGRFRICPPEEGEFTIEIRSADSGTARRTIRRSSVSPPMTDLGDIRLPAPAEFAARVVGCDSGSLALSGPLGGETSLPALLRFPLDSAGHAAVRLPDGGAWTVWATCGGANERIEPALLPSAGELAGTEVRFLRAGRLDQPPADGD